jgi:hypothetical protein
MEGSGSQRGGGRVVAVGASGGPTTVRINSTLWSARWWVGGYRPRGTQTEIMDPRTRWEHFAPTFLMSNRIYGLQNMIYLSWKYI